MLFLPETIKLFSHPLPGRVCEPITRHSAGRVEFQSSFWDAELYDPTCTTAIQPGQRVRVIGLRGIILLVMPSA